MKVTQVKFRDAVLVPGRNPSTDLSAKSSDSLSIEYGANLLRLAYDNGQEVRAVVVPAANIAYMQLAPEPKAKP